LGRYAHTVDLWSLVHRQFGPSKLSSPVKAAAQELEDVLRDEAGLSEKLRVEPFSFRVEKR
jgi:hypothetical protein